MHKLVNANAVLRELCHSVARKRVPPNIAKMSIFKSIFVLIFIYDNESCVATERVLSHAQAAETQVFVTKTSRRTNSHQIAQYWNSWCPERLATYNLKRKIWAKVVRPRDQNTKKDLRDTSCWVYPRESALDAWSLEGFFPGRATCIFFQRLAKCVFPRGVKSGEISFYPHRN